MKQIAALLILLFLATACSWTNPEAGQFNVSEQMAPATRRTRPSPTATITPSETRPAQASVTPTATATVPTVQPTEEPLSPTPAPTATSTATPLSPSALVPALGTEAESYGLREWTAQAAHALIAQLEAYPETLSEEERGYGEAAYYAAFRYAALAQLEALHRFPNAETVERWRWGLAYNYVRSGDERAAPYYATLFQQALTVANPAPETLIRWLERRELRFSYSLTETDVPPGLEAAYVLEMRAGESGTYFWLLKGEEGYQVHALNGRGDFDLAYGAGLSYDLIDVTGDGVRDLVSIHGHQPGNEETFYYTNLVLYDLSQMPPRRLLFQPAETTHLGWGERDSWSVVRTTNGGTRLRLRGLLSHHCQAVELVTDYAWDGEFLQQTGSQYNVRLDAAGDVRFCLPFIYSAAEQGNRDALQYLAAIAAEATSKQTGVQADEWRYRLALYYALAGDYTQASVYLTAVISEAVDPSSELLREANRFYENYQSPEDLYRACAAVDMCNEQLALQRLISTLRPTAYAVVTEHLQRWGVSVNRSGFADLDGDGQLEQWLLVNQPNFQMSVWLLLHTQDGLRALYVDTITRNDLDFSLERLTPVQNRPVIRLRSGQEERLFTVYQQEGAEPLVTLLRSTSENESGNYTAQFLYESLSALLVESAQFRPITPQELITRLLTYQSSPAYNCRDGAYATLCADYAYTIALAYELAGDTANAVEAYGQLWRDYPDGAHAIMARYKLEAAAAPTATAPRPSP